MFKRKYSVMLFILALLTTVNTAFAADTTSGVYPHVLLVQLKTEQNRINALIKGRQYKDLEEVTRDAKKVREATINDFHDHFDFCPVYYFMDTNIEAIKNKQFQGVLLNADLSVVKAPLIDQNSKDYYIVYFGYPKAQKLIAPPYSNTIDENIGQRLVILDDQYNQLTYLSGPYGPQNTGNRNRKVRYSYNSRHFDIKYIPVATAFQNTRQIHRAVKKQNRKKRKKRD